jgi:hypothetical protein
VPPRRLWSTTWRGWARVLGIDDIGAGDDFFMGGDSLQAAVIVNRLQERLGQVLYVVALFDAPTVAALAAYLAHHYPGAEERLCGVAPGGAIERSGAPVVTDEPPVDAASEASLRRLIRPLPPLGARAVRHRNASAVFVLAPPRSGSTLFRVLLGGHPRLFSPPELLLGFNAAGAAAGLQDRLNLARNDPCPHGDPLCDADGATRFMEECEARDLTTQAFYRLLQDELGERRLVDKTPGYSLDTATLRRAEDLLRAPLHPPGAPPAAVTRSFRRRGWTASSTSSLLLLACPRGTGVAGLPPQRGGLPLGGARAPTPSGVLRGTGQGPGPVLEACGSSGARLRPRHAQAYREKRQRMTDGVHPLSRGLVDVKFHQHRRIDPPPPRAGERPARGPAGPTHMGSPRRRLSAPRPRPQTLEAIRPAASTASDLLRRLDLSEAEIDGLLIRAGPPGNR